MNSIILVYFCDSRPWRSFSDLCSCHRTCECAQPSYSRDAWKLHRPWSHHTKGLDGQIWWSVWGSLPIPPGLQCPFCCACGWWTCRGRLFSRWDKPFLSEIRPAFLQRFCGNLIVFLCLQVEQNLLRAVDALMGARPNPPDQACLEGSGHPLCPQFTQMETATEGPPSAIGSLRNGPHLQVQNTC